MHKFLTFIFFALFTTFSHAEFDWDSVDLDLFDLEGLTPRYAYMVDDKYLGKMHYVGMSYFRKRGVISDGLTGRVGLGDHGTRVNISYTNTFSFFGVDIGLSYNILEDNHPLDHGGGINGLTAELGARMWVVQAIASHGNGYSYIKLAYGF